MTAQENNIIRDDVSEAVTDMAEKLLPVIARKKAALEAPDTPGASFLYDVKEDWQTDALRQDDRICQVRNTRELEASMDDTDIKAILIPADGAITRAAAMQICSRHRQSKTIFYERQK